MLIERYRTLYYSGVLMDCLIINYKSCMKMCLTPCSRGGMTNQNITAKDKKANFLKNILEQTWTKYQISGLYLRTFCWQCSKSLSLN